MKLRNVLEQPEVTFEEDRYVGGYVVRKLREQPNCAKFKPLLNELVCDDSQNKKINSK